MVGSIDVSTRMVCSVEGWSAVDAWKLRKNTKRYVEGIARNVDVYIDPWRVQSDVFVVVWVNDLISRLHQGEHIDDMTNKWFVHTPNPPRIPILYTLTKIHKPKLVGRPIISGCDGPTERISSFVDTLLQPIAQKQKSFIKDTTDFISFIEKTKIGKDTILVSMDVSSLYTNIPQKEGMEIVCKAYDSFHNYNPLIATPFLKEMLGLILNKNWFQLNGENCLQTHGTAIGTKMAVPFPNIFWPKLKQR